MPLRFESAVALLICGSLVCLAASPSSIGFLVTNGQAMVDGAAVQRNSTLFQGSLVEARNVSSDLMLPGGSNLLLQAGSAANVYRDYAILRQGTATERGGRGYAVFAHGLRISSLSPAGTVTVGLTNGSHLDVSAKGDGAEVRNAAGMLLARLDAGKALSFAVQEPSQTPAPGAPAASPATPPAAATPGLPAPGQQVVLHGVVRKDHAGRYGHYLLTDVPSKITYEIQGSELDDLVGGSVEATGTILATPAAETAVRVLSVSDIHQMTMGEITGNQEPAETAPSAEAAAAGTPTPAPEATPPAPSSAKNSPAVASSQPPQAAPEETQLENAPPPLPVHSDTAKVLLIVGLAAGAGVGVALGLAGGKSSTVSPE